jgi:hypothetical protein
MGRHTAQVGWLSLSNMLAQHVAGCGVVVHSLFNLSMALASIAQTLPRHPQSSARLRIGFKGVSSAADAL